MVSALHASCSITWRHCATPNVWRKGQEGKQKKKSLWKRLYQDEEKEEEKKKLLEGLWVVCAVNIDYRLKAIRIMERRGIKIWRLCFLACTWRKKDGGKPYKLTDLLGRLDASLKNAALILITVHISDQHPEQKGNLSSGRSNFLHLNFKRVWRGFQDWYWGFIYLKMRRLEKKRFKEKNKHIVSCIMNVIKHNIVTGELSSADFHPLILQLCRTRPGKRVSHRPRKKLASGKSGRTRDCVVLSWQEILKRCCRHQMGWMEPT